MKTLLLLFALFASISFGEEPPLTILAASSLKDVLEDIGRLYEKETGQSIRFSFDASGVLAGQIEKGAPADVFISDGSSWMDSLVGQKLVDPATRRTLARNRLVVAQPAPHDVFIQVPADLVRLNRIALGDPATVPAGHYARQFLEKQNLWTPLQSRLVYAANVRAALALVEHDEVGAALVYATDVKSVTSEPGVRTSFVVESSQYSPIAYEAAILKEAPRRMAATKFFWTLETPEAKAAWPQRGFEPGSD